MKLLPLFVSTLLIFPAGLAQTKVATVHICVLKSRSGKPIKHADTSSIVFPLSPYTTPIDRIADKRGNLSLLVPTEGQITVTVSKYTGCQHLSKADHAKGPVRLSLQEILATGVLDANGCRMRNAVTTPGELIVYVRPMHWWERFHD